MLTLLNMLTDWYVCISPHITPLVLFCLLPHLNFGTFFSLHRFHELKMDSSSQPIIILVIISTIQWAAKMFQVFFHEFSTKN